MVSSSWLTLYSAKDEQHRLVLYMDASQPDWDSDSFNSLTQWLKADKLWWGEPRFVHCHVQASAICAEFPRPDYLQMLEDDIDAEVQDGRAQGNTLAETSRHSLGGGSTCITSEPSKSSATSNLGSKKAHRPLLGNVDPKSAPVEKAPVMLPQRPSKAIPNTVASFSTGESPVSPQLRRSTRAQVAQPPSDLDEV